MLFISHRVKNALNADRVYLFNKEGSIQEEGTPEELLSRDSSFKTLVASEDKWEAIA